MKGIILAVALVAVIAAPMLAFACPPPPAPGYDGPGVGGGPDPGAETPDLTDTGGDDSDSGGASDPDAGTSECVL
ncbi:MAG: hypothetical protein HYY18_13345 [Planctomycetes bacterium]|nr:hypothetical protein [Planctomycetota bacterium]